MNKLKSSNKSFGFVFSIFFAIIFFYYFINKDKAYWIFIILSLAFGFFAFIYPKIFNVFNKVWIKFGEFLGKVVSPLVMMVIYFTVVLFTSIVLKVINKDIMNLKINTSSKTFWKKKDQKTGNMQNQF